MLRNRYTARRCCLFHTHTLIRCFTAQRSNDNENVGEPMECSSGLLPARLLSLDFIICVCVCARACACSCRVCIGLRREESTDAECTTTTMDTTMERLKMYFAIPPGDREKEPQYIMYRQRLPSSPLSPWNASGNVVAFVLVCCCCCWHRIFCLSLSSNFFFSSISFSLRFSMLFFSYSYLFITCGC